MPPEVNSLEWYDIITAGQEPGNFADSDTLSLNPRVHKLKSSGKCFHIKDRLGSVNRRRPLDELLKLGETE
jgi:hypothetical protein